jgi:hypothetical protein
LILPSFLPTLQYLKRLDLSSSLKGDTQALSLAESTAFKYLEFLKLKNCGIGNLGLTGILGSSGFRRLKILIVSKNAINKLILPDEAASKAVGRRELMDLSLLDLRENQLTGTIKQFSHKFLRNTVVLGWDNSFADKATETYLARSKIYAGLQATAHSAVADK